jgi:hypothetical protein
MLNQFRNFYPEGGLISELLTIDHGKFIVRVTVQANGVILGTGLAAADTIEKAEDQARIRALALVNLNSTPPIKATVVTAPQTPPPVKVEPKPEPLATPPLESISESSPIAQLVTEPTLDLSFAPEVSPSSLSNHHESVEQELIITDSPESQVKSF